MSDYTVTHLDEIDTITDGRCPWRPVRLHFGIMSFGVNAWTAKDAGDRIINEHDEAEEDANEERYLVQKGRATFELDVPGVPPSATIVVPGSSANAVRLTPGRAKTNVPVGARGGRSGRPSTRSTRPASAPRPPTAAES